MISFHRNTESKDASHFRCGFEAVNCTEVERVANCITNFVWSPIWWEGGYRSQANFISARWLALDFDDGEMSLDEAKDTFCDMIHVIGTTKSHRVRKDGGPPLDRFRVLILFEKPIEDITQYKYNLTRVFNIYPCDKAPKDGARFFFPCKEIVQMEGDGFHADVHDTPQRFDQHLMRVTKMQRDNLILPRYIKRSLDHKSVQGENRNTKVFKLGCFFGKTGHPYNEALEIVIKSDCSDLGLDETTSAFTKGFRTGRKEMIHDEKGN